MDNDDLLEVHPYFKEIAKTEGFYSDDLMRTIAKKGTLHGIDGIPEHIKKVFVTAHDVDPEYHIRMQAAFQRYTDNAVSKTVNFPNAATRDDVKKVYWLAYTLGCKGVTIYRDGSRDIQILSTVKETKKEAPLGKEKAEITGNEADFQSSKTCEIRFENGQLISDCGTE
jgi:ribonucleoside-diphosphate reductase alpha chain